MSDNTEILIAATGPSLDRVADWSALPKIRIAVNYAARVVPDCQYLCAVDICPPAYILTGSADHKMVRFATREQAAMLAEYHIGVDCVFDYHNPIGSLDTAVAFAISKWCRRIYFVGVDPDCGANADSLADCYDATSPDAYAAWCNRVWARCVDLMLANMVEWRNV